MFPVGNKKEVFLFPLKITKHMTNLEQIRQYIVDFQKRKFATFERDLKVKFTKQFIVSIVGARRVGKTYFLFSLINQLKNRKEVLYVDFDYPEFLDFTGRDLKQLIDLHLQTFGNLKYVFLDEIQNLKNWEKGLREIYELKKYFIFIAGSSSKLLSKELATELRGRTLSYQLFPLSFKEVLRIQGISFGKEPFSSSEKNKLIFEFEKYLLNGGYPQVFLEKDLKEQIVKDYKDLVLFRDLVEIYKLKNLYVVKRFFEYLIASFAKEISIDKFYNYLKSQNISLSKKTLYNYLDYFESSLFFHLLKSHRLRERIKKVYLNDVVFAEKSQGRRLENLVFLGFARRGQEVRFFKQKLECDFVSPKTQAVQVCWGINEQNQKREIKGLIEAMSYFRIKEGLILTYNQERQIKEGGRIIKVLPVWKWLLLNQ